MKDSLNIRGKKIPITCSQCGHEFDELVARLEDNDEIPCPAGCGLLFKTSEFNLTGTVEEALDDFKKSLGNIKGFKIEP